MPGYTKDKHHQEKCNENNRLSILSAAWVDPEHAEYRSFQKGETYYFCSPGC